MNQTVLPPIVLAAGGTGGHIFPAEALAEALIARGRQPILITDKRFADYNTKSYQGVIGDIPIYYIRASALGGGLLRKARNGLGILVGMWQARNLLKNMKPSAVVGFGGYPSFPTMMAASGLHFNTLIHEQNSVLGRANRVLAPRVRRIALSFADTLRLPEDCKGKTTLTGNPVRAAIRALGNIPYPAPSEDGTLHLLILGGSQGASVFARILPEALMQLPEPLRARIRVDHQCRAEDLQKTRAQYQALGISADLAPFFNDVPARLASAHLVICRAGASTVAELACAGRPAILVPYPSATDDHQRHNAHMLEDVGGAWVMGEEGFTSEALAARLESFLTLPGALTKAAQLVRKVGRAQAAEALCDLVLAMEAKNTPRKETPAPLPSQKRAV